MIFCLFYISRRMNKFWIILMCMLLILSGCARPWADTDSEGWDQTETAQEKKDYFVETKSLAKLSWTPTLNKTGKITGKSDVTVTSQSSGRVSRILYEEGQSPTKGAKVISLADSANLYNFSISRNKESVEWARINYNSNKVNLDNSIVDLQLAVERAQQQYDVSVQDAQKIIQDNKQQLLDTEKQLRDNELKKLDTQQQIKDAEQQRILAEYSARTNNPDDPLWSANLSLQKFDSDIEKAEFDYQTKLDADKQTLEWFVNSVEVIQTTIKNIFETTLDGVDKILWVTPINRTNNDIYEPFLWAQDTSTVVEAEASLRTLLAYQFELASFPLTVDNVDQMSNHLRDLEDSLDLLDELLTDVERVLWKTITWNVFPQSQLDALKAQIDGYQAQVVGQAWSVVQQINSIEWFLATYQQNQNSLAKSIDILKEQRWVTEQQLRDAAINAEISAERADIWGDRTLIAAERSAIGNERVDISIERTKIGLERANLQAEAAAETARLALVSAQNALAAANRTKNLSLSTLQNSIDQAQIAYNESLANAWKLSVSAPIAWSIGEVLVDVGEEVSPGTPLFTLTTTKDQEVTITLNSDEKDQVKEWSLVNVVIWEKELWGKIVSISDIADDQLLYKTTIELDQLSDRLWEIVDVEIPLNSTYTLIPLSVVTMQTTKKWSVRVRNGQEPEQAQVDLGQVRGKNIEIRSPLWEGLELIVSPMDNYDRVIHDAKEKEEERETE